MPNNNGDQSLPEEFKRRRRRERWSAFLTPLITLAAIVVSISFLMFIIRTCELRAPQQALSELRGGPPPTLPSPASPRPQQAIG